MNIKQLVEKPSDFKESRSLDAKEYIINWIRWHTGLGFFCWHRMTACKMS
jgi:hypothetical protein